jgi:Putative Actinobacterial Holin-X, holin superfamily III
LTACVIAALSLALPIWLAALIVALVLLAIGGGLGLAGKAEIQRGGPPVPEEAVKSTKEDVAWLKAQAKSARP